MTTTKGEKRPVAAPLQMRNLLID